MKSLHWIILVMQSLMITSVANAGYDRVTLQEAITRALANSHILKAVQFQKNSATAAVSASRSRYLPHLALQSGAVLSNSPSRVFMMKMDEGRINPSTDFTANTLNNPDARGDFYTTLMLEQPLFDLSIGTSVDMAGKELAARSNMQSQRQEDITFMVMQAYYEISRAKAFQVSAEQAVTDAREHLRLAVLRTETGLGLKSDELRARTYLSNLEGELITANNNIVVARLRLNDSVGGKIGDQLDIADETNHDNLKGQTTETLMQTGLQNRKDLLAGEAEVEKAELGVKSVRNSYLPSIYASAAYQINDRDVPLGTDNSAWTVGLNLRWELFDGFRRGAEKDSASAMMNAARESLEHQRKEVALQIEESILRRTESVQRVEVARNAVHDATEGMRLIQKRFENSLAPMVDLLDAQTALNQARANLVQAENYNALAAATVLYRAGILLKETKK